MPRKSYRDGEQVVTAAKQPHRFVTLRNADRSKVYVVTRKKDDVVLHDINDLDGKGETLSRTEGIKKIQGMINDEGFTWHFR